MSNTGVLLELISRQITIIFGTMMLTLGMIGGILSMLVFLSLRTFRESPCALYLTIMSLVNMGNLLTGLLSRIIISGFGIDWTSTSSFYCKFRWYALQFCVLTSFSCVSLASIDQYFRTHTALSRRKWSSMKYAQRLITLLMTIWFIHGFFYFIYFDLAESPVNHQFICTSKNDIFASYHLYGYLITLAGILPLLTTSIFGILAVRNVKRATDRSVPLFKRELDKQLTNMVFIHFLHNIIVTSPYTILMITTSIIGKVKNQTFEEIINFSKILVVLLYYLTASNPFYIYLFSSERFRNQLMYVILGTRSRQNQRAGMMIDQIATPL